MTEHDAGEGTRLDIGHEQAASGVASRILSLRLLDPGTVRTELDAYLGSASDSSFTSHLVAKGLLGLTELSALEETAPRVERSDAEVEIGSRFSGCVIEKKLGQGGMGIVYRARRDADGERVVVKFLLPEHLHDSVWRARFLREALLLRGLDCPYVVKVHAVEVEGARPHIVMELVEGHDLEDRLAEAGRLEPAEATRIARDVALGLAAAHAHGVIHRDIKPGNVRIGPDGAVKILDFGLAKNVQTDDRISLAGQILGTPYYMAPEQWGDHEVDARCDVYSLGATLFHLVTGQVPFPGERSMAIRRAILSGIFPRPRSLAPAVGEDLELVILRMMAFDRRVRHATAASCAADLGRVLEGRPIAVPSLVEVATGRRHALLPGISFAVGSGPDCAICLASPQVAPHHVVVELGASGYHLHHEGGAAPTAIDGMRATSAALRPGDRIRLGDVELTFDDGGVGAALGGTRRLAPRARDAAPLPDAFVEALAAAGDRRVVAALVERVSLAAIEARVASTRRSLRSNLGGEAAELAGSRLEAILKRRRADALGALFRITHENLGDELEPWLRWWEDAAASYPPQVAPYRLLPNARLRVVAGEDAPRTVELDERASWVLGRGTGCDVVLRNLSVSRTHASIRRFQDAFVIEDQASRLGVRVNGKPASRALLRPGDRIALGKVEIVFDADDFEAAPPRADDGSLVADVALVDALAELHHPSVALALARFAAAPGQLEWVPRFATRFTSGAAEAALLAEAVVRIYVARADDARKRLPRVLPELVQVPVADWPRHVEGRRAALPPQVFPIAWFPERRG